MNRRRDYGQDLPFCDWLRNHEGLPSISATMGFVATDVDLAIHRYLTLVDGAGTRELQFLMQLEVKTRSGQLPSSQRDTLFKQHCCSCGQLRLFNQLIHHYGVAVLSLDGTRPDDSTIMNWGRFNGWGRVNWREINQDQLLDLLRFDIDPDSLCRVVYCCEAGDGSILMHELGAHGDTHAIGGGQNAIN